MSRDERIRILIIEDEPIIAMELQRLVEARGYAVVGSAASSSAALDLLQSPEIDGAIVDFILGDDSCEIVADKLDAMGIPWALTTGLDVREIASRFRNVPVLTKPYLTAEINAVLDKLYDSSTG